MGKHEIDDLISISYGNATQNVMTIINRAIGREVLSPRDRIKAEEIAKKLNVMFDENGEIAK